MTPRTASLHCSEDDLFFIDGLFRSDQSLPLFDLAKVATAAVPLPIATPSSPLPPPSYSDVPELELSPLLTPIRPRAVERTCSISPLTNRSTPIRAFIGNGRLFTEAGRPSFVTPLRRRGVSVSSNASTELLLGSGSSSASTEVLVFGTPPSSGSITTVPGTPPPLDYDLRDGLKVDVLVEFGPLMQQLPAGVTTKFVREGNTIMLALTGHTKTLPTEENARTLLGILAESESASRASSKRPRRL